jgi:hypothetical protein
MQGWGVSLIGWDSCVVDRKRAGASRRTDQQWQRAAHHKTVDFSPVDIDLATVTKNPLGLSDVTGQVGLEDRGPFFMTLRRFRPL